MSDLSFLKSAPKSRFRSTVVRQAPERVERNGGDDKFGFISQASLIAKGEALGHGMWIDDDMLSQVFSALDEKGPAGLKARFTHPGLSSDGTGKLLGKFKNPTLKDGKVFADLHFVKAAHNSPDGNLASYVMDLAEGSPDMFGISIVFARDIKAEMDFRDQNSVNETSTDPYDGEEFTSKVFKSPDPANEKNLRHARLSKLFAADAVDEPAANPDGLFHREFAMVEEAEGIARFALGLSEDAPETSAFSTVHPERVRGFFQRVLEAEGLEIVDKSAQVDRSLSLKATEANSSKPMKDEKTTQPEAPAKEEPVAATPAELSTPSAPADAGKVEVNADEYAEFLAAKKEKQEAEEKAELKAHIDKIVDEKMAKLGAKRNGDSPAAPSPQGEAAPVSYDSLFQAEVVDKENGDRFHDMKLAQEFKKSHGTRSEYEAKINANK